MSSQATLNGLAGLPVFLSASLPDHLYGSPQCQDLSDFLVTLVGGIWARRGTLVFGGHPTITPLLHRVCLNQGVGEGERPGLHLYQHNRFRTLAPSEIDDRRVFGKPQWHGTQDADASSFEREMHEMRQAMVERSKAAIFVGGRWKEGDEKRQGIREEYELFLAEHNEGPVYLVGFLDGVARQIAEELRRAGGREPNGLSAEELEVVHRSENVDFVAGVILSDLQRQAAG